MCRPFFVASRCPLAPAGWMEQDGCARRRSRGVRCSRGWIKHNRDARDRSQGKVPCGIPFNQHGYRPQSWSPKQKVCVPCVHHYHDELPGTSVASVYLDNEADYTRVVRIIAPAVCVLACRKVDRRYGPLNRPALQNSLLNLAPICGTMDPQANL